MTTLKIQNFSGIAPRYSTRLLPNNVAQVAANCNLLSGELRGFHEAQSIKDFNPDNPTSSIKRAFRIPEVITSPTPINTSDPWVYFYDSNVDFIRSPVLEDSFERYYWTGDSYKLSGAPQYNTRANILASNAPYLLGVPTPANAPTVAPPAGLIETRTYIYTFVSAYGEEGPPSPPTTATGTIGSWDISGFDTTVPNSASRNITTVRIYRTVAGATETEYYWVADVALGTASYADTATDQSVSNNNTLPSLTWTEPPSTLLGLVAHPGGFLVGFSGRDLYLSEPYQPHAWPVQYIQTCDTEIMGVSIFGNVIVICTTSHLYYGEGMTPDNITFQKLQSIDPCVSRRSIVTTVNGVYYASPQGIIHFDGAQAQLVSYQIFTREEWQNYFSPTTVNAVAYGVQYIAFDTSDSGFIFSPYDILEPFVGPMESPAGMAGQKTPLTTLDRFSNVTGVQIDQYSGDAYIISNNRCLLWDPPASIPYTYTWTSKDFDLPKPVNFGAMRLKFASNPVTLSSSQVTDYSTFNTGRIATQLNPWNGCAYNGVRTATVAGYYGAQIRNPIGGGPLFQITSLTNVNPAVQVTLYARDLDSNWDTVFTWLVQNERIVRLPAGFKSDGWRVELIGNAAVYSIALAETGKELKTV